MQQGPEAADVLVLSTAVLVEAVALPILHTDAALARQQLIQDLGSSIPARSTCHTLVLWTQTAFVWVTVCAGTRTSRCACPGNNTDGALAGQELMQDIRSSMSAKSTCHAYGVNFAAISSTVWKLL